MALCLSSWTSVVALSLREEVNSKKLTAYVIVTALGIYTQPFSVFVSIAHFVAFVIDSRRCWRQVFCSCLALAIVFGLFLPWYLYASPFWRSEIQLSPARLRLADGLLIVRELVGGGYHGTLALLGAAVLGVRELARDIRWFWILYLIIPVLGPLVADYCFGYFLAVRQMIYVIVPISLLGALGIQSIMQRKVIVAKSFMGFLICACLLSSISFYMRPREDWKATSQRIRAEAEKGACVVLSPPTSAYIYRFFLPYFSQYTCPPDFINFKTVALVSSPYQAPTDRLSVEAKFAGEHWREVRRYRFNGPEVVVFQK